MFKHIPVLGAIFPAAAALWFVHPNSATATVAGVSGAAALAEVKLKAMNEARKERKAAKAAAKAQADAPQLPTVQAPYALPQGMVDLGRFDKRVVDQAGQVVERYSSN